MRCQDIMKKDVECVSPQDTAQAAAKRMRDENIGFLPVCDESKVVLGTITDRDLAIRVLADGNQPNTSVQDVMTREVVACPPEEDLRKAQELMSKHHKSRILCVDANGLLVGVISLSDIAQSSGGEAVKTLRQVSEREARA
jgi:CBS domain-containing protein